MTSKTITSSATDIARNYYNSDNAESFYSQVWGGEDIHIGIYHSPDEPIVEASRRSVQWMAKRLTDVDHTIKILDIGSGYGGAARYLAKTFGCSVTALNLSDVENDRARALNKSQKLDHLIDVVDGSFEALPFGASSFDYVWSQDAILHSGDRPKVVQEVARVLKLEGQFVFTDIMKSDSCPGDVLQPILDRIHLADLASVDFYKRHAKESGLTHLEFENLSQHLVTHYTNVLKETKSQQALLSQSADVDYLENMKTGLQHWIHGGQKNYLSWGILQFKKTRAD